MSRLDGVYLHLQRAKHHIRDLDQRIHAFRGQNPYRIVCENNPYTLERIYKVRVQHRLPAELGLIAGEVTHHLRASLDHLAYQLVEANGNVPTKQTYFPICETLAKYTTQAPGKVQGISTGAVRVIDSLKPYGGGNDLFWKLHEMNNWDKHRLLLIISNRVDNAELVITNGSRTPQSAMIVLGAPVPVLAPGQLRVLEDGTEVGRVAGNLGQNVQTNLDIQFEIAFQEPGIVAGEPVLALLNQMVSLVENLVKLFVPLL